MSRLIDRPLNKDSSPDISSSKESQYSKDTLIEPRLDRSTVLEELNAKEPLPSDAHFGMHTLRASPWARSPQLKEFTGYMNYLLDDFGKTPERIAADRRQFYKVLGRDSATSFDEVKSGYEAILKQLSEGPATAQRKTLNTFFENGRVNYEHLPNPSNDYGAKLAYEANPRSFESKYLPHSQRKVLVAERRRQAELEHAAEKEAEQEAKTAARLRRISIEKEANQLDPTGSVQIHPRRRREYARMELAGLIETDTPTSRARKFAGVERLGYTPTSLSVESGKEFEIRAENIKQNGIGALSFQPMSHLVAHYNHNYDKAEFRLTGYNPAGEPKSYLERAQRGIALMAADYIAKGDTENLAALKKHVLSSHYPVRYEFTREEIEKIFDPNQALEKIDRDTPAAYQARLEMAERNVKLRLEAPASLNVSAIDFVDTVVAESYNLSQSDLNELRVKALGGVAALESEPAPAVTEIEVDIPSVVEGPKVIAPNQERPVFLNDPRPRAEIMRAPLVQDMRETADEIFLEHVRLNKETDPAVKARGLAELSEQMKSLPHVYRGELYSEILDAYKINDTIHQSEIEKAKGREILDWMKDQISDPNTVFTYAFRSLLAAETQESQQSVIGHLKRLDTQDKIALHNRTLEAIHYWKTASVFEQNIIDGIADTLEESLPHLNH